MITRWLLFVSVVLTISCAGAPSDPADCQCPVTDPSVLVAPGQVAVGDEDGTLTSDPGLTYDAAQGALSVGGTPQAQTPVTLHTNATSGLLMSWIDATRGASWFWSVDGVAITNPGAAARLTFAAGTRGLALEENAAGETGFPLLALHGQVARTAPLVALQLAQGQTGPALAVTGSAGQPVASLNADGGAHMAYLDLSVGTPAGTPAFGHVFLFGCAQGSTGLCVKGPDGSVIAVGP